MTYWWILTRQADVKTPSPPFSPTHVTLWRSFSSSKSICNVPCRSGMRLEGLGTMEGSDNWISGHFGAPHIFYGGLRCLFEVTNKSRYVCNMYASMQVCVCAYVCICLCVYVCVSMCVCVYVCMQARRCFSQAFFPIPSYKWTSTIQCTQQKNSHRQCTWFQYVSIGLSKTEGHPRGNAGRDHMRTPMI